MDEGLKSGSFTDLPEQNVEQNVASGKHLVTSEPVSCTSPSRDDTSPNKEGNNNQMLVTDQGIYHPQTSYYGDYYPGYNGLDCSEWDDLSCFFAGDGVEMPLSGGQSDDLSMFFCMPGYSEYISEALLGLDEQCVGQQSFFPSSKYPQPQILSDPEAVSSSSGYSTSHVVDSQATVSVLASAKPNVCALSGESTPLVAESQNRAAVLASPKSNVSAPSSAALLKLKYSTKTKGPVDSEASARPLDSKTCASAKSSNYFNSSFHSQSLKPANEQGSTFQSAGLPKKYYPNGKFSSFSNQGNGGSSQQNGFRNSRPDGRSQMANDRVQVREKFNIEGVYDSASNLSRGPRDSRLKGAMSSSSEKNQLSSLIRRDQYNLKDFVIRYEQAMFFVIKSFSEDDIHRSIKYNVWASTQFGNKKLDAAFHDAETRSSEKGTSCPIFLFFSVNGSGQFVGLAEMIGQVDFKKNMDFWQSDSKWDGFFPVKWHIVKDIPSYQLHHIILENNYNRPVTHTRDTQEIGFSQGLEMLKIFKNYSAKASILDDFAFYEDREKSKSCDHRRAYSRTKNNSSQGKHLEIAGVNKVDEVSIRTRQDRNMVSTRAKKTVDSNSPLITLADKLSLRDSTLQKNATMKETAAKLDKPIRTI